ncbi:glycoside hydrolase family 3 N-terminal domain-containing protein [[Pseudopropionibacterium] massiliense]|uniref:glycoside hydrolase family 3 N-terminal domain-containing protein n=1 Tax=[Pseudopropionibacterium] massiliense TaxID=2220000 RepID=UPI001030D464|nr:glycoside hydrolase family 3 N-terminal domain-containing protein [[Pseudopropionibacterium] massiliense]
MEAVMADAAHRTRARNTKKQILGRRAPLQRIAAAAACASILIGCSAESAATSPASQVTTETSDAAASEAPPESSPSASPTPATVRCRAKADSLTTEQQAGQLFMIGVGTSGLDDKTRSAIESGSVGSVVLLGSSSEGAARISAITSELGTMQSAGMPLLVAVDQEGGQVQRLKGPGFSDIPNAVEQGSLADGQLRARAQAWGAELAAAGVHYDLAPVADVVPKHKQSSNAPIGKMNRNFGNDVTAVSRSVVEFTQGMQDAGVVTSLKHFPGLGEVTVNTDHGVAKDGDTTAGGESLEPFRRGIEAGAGSVMISSAIFTRIDPDQEGVFSRKIVTDMLRGDLGFQGVAISDDLGAAVAVDNVKPGDRAVRFFAAGGDLLINADPSLMDEMLKATIAWAAENPGNADRLAESAGRVLALKESAGLLNCG